ncbi:uncharacterized protein CC84DRAFT_666373 [Paraphaeosphaeria sporulosa]|uniref:Uncharacterized protein n=1 Tax=Paraphaeosphaeria sporulosa TaxID=1460663 RepID=A0A177CL96_9PLEO|nr:uncharacterized protein CC84DRAFT_666373 [Paraphaeosphaeria sporulosa]OAG07557.1 hypothetical protein CC84DRAFT_666373 [Paraphaeosphaeria sporulosa]
MNVLAEACSMSLMKACDDFQAPSSEGENILPIKLMALSTAPETPQKWHSFLVEHASRDSTCKIAVTRNNGEGSDSTFARIMLRSGCVRTMLHRGSGLPCPCHESSSTAGCVEHPVARGAPAA